MTKEITCHCDGRMIRLSLDPQMKLSDLRQRLLNEKVRDKPFLPADKSKEISFNFINGKIDPVDVEAILADTKTYPDYTIIARSLESSLPIESILCGGTAVVMFNTLAKSNKSLIGFKTHWWVDRQMHVCCQRFGAGEFEPLMLQHVVAMGGGDEKTKKTPVTILNNVCICPPDMNATFVIHAKGGVGFRFSIHVNTEDKSKAITDGLFRVYSKEEGEGAVWLSRWGDEDKAIKISATRSLNIDGRVAAYYQQVTVKCTKVISFMESGGRVIRAKSVTRGGDNGKIDVAPIDGKRIEPSTPTKGDPTGHTFGTIYNVKMDESAVLGELTIWFFNFRTLQDAREVFEYTDPMEFTYN